MKSIQSDNYPIYFIEDAYRKLNAYLSENKSSKVFVLVDENTNEHCFSIFKDQITTEIEGELIAIAAGEYYKNIDTCIEIWSQLTDSGADRNSLLINLGGGVVTDMGGFAASAFKRGIKFINIPTTLLSMVDASVGGKTGVDFGVLKNQIGLFSNPEMVLIDSQYLATVTEREIRSGMAEIIKYGLTYDIELWNQIKGLEDLEISILNKIIYRSIEIKNVIVLEDPKEKNIRKILNFGHTLGHAIESYHLESEEKESLTHGEAIAIGMITESYISHKLLNFPMETLEEIKKVIISIYTKFNIEKSDYKPIIDLLKHDKKNSNGEVNFVLLSNIEDYKLNCKVPEDLIKESLDYYSL